MIVSDKCIFFLAAHSENDMSAQFYCSFSAQYNFSHLRGTCPNTNIVRCFHNEKRSPVVAVAAAIYVPYFYHLAKVWHQNILYLHLSLDNNQIEINNFH